MGKNNKRFSIIVEVLGLGLFGLSVLAIISVIGFAFLKSPFLMAGMSLSFFLLLLGIYTACKCQGGTFNGELFVVSRDDIEIKSEGDISLIGVFGLPITSVLTIISSFIFLTKIIPTPIIYDYQLIFFIFAGFNVIFGFIMFLISVRNISLVSKYIKRVE